MKKELERLVGYFNAATYDPLLAAVTEYTIIKLARQESTTPAIEGAMLVCTAGIIMLKNIYDYQRVDEHVKTHGWNTMLFATPYGSKAATYAEANKMMTEYQRAREEYNQKRSK